MNYFVEQKLLINRNNAPEWLLFLMMDIRNHFDRNEAISKSKDSIFDTIEEIKNNLVVKSRKSVSSGSHIRIERIDNDLIIYSQTGKTPYLCVSLIPTEQKEKQFLL